MFRSPIAVAMLALLASVASAEAPPQSGPPLVEEYLISGRLADGRQALLVHLESHPKDDQARFGLGTLEFLQAVEHLGQSAHRYGFGGPKSWVLRMFVTPRARLLDNPSPEPISYDDARNILKTMVRDLAVAEKTLGSIEDRSVRLPLHFALIKLDITADGTASPEESLLRLYSQLNLGRRLPGEILGPKEKFLIAFDYGDVCWLRGYCNLLTAMCEMILAHDEETFFQAFAPQIFAKPVGAVSHEPFSEDTDGKFMLDIVDVVTVLHLANFRVTEPERMKKALGHLKEVIRLSRESWDAIEAETDNDHEWIPNSDQVSALNIRVFKEMIAGWKLFLDEAEKTLDGEQLVPHPRFKPEYGINLRRVFEEPRTFDVIPWIQGVGALPYTEKGPVAKQETWARLQELFRGQFIGFAFWFN